MNVRRAAVPALLLLLAAGPGRSGGMTRAAPLERPSVPTLSPLNMKLSIQVRNEFLGQVLETITAQTKANFLMADDLTHERVTIDANDKPTGEILKTALGSKGMAYRRVGRTNCFVVAWKARDAAARAQADMMMDHAALGAGLTVSLADAPLQEFLDAVAAQTKSRFALDPGLEGARVTANLQDVAAREALGMVLEIKGLDIVPIGRNAFRVKPAPKRAGS